LLDEWLDYVSRSVFRGGCFFMASAIEFDSRPGKVHDVIAQMSRSWLDAIESEVRYAQELRQLNSGIDPSQLAFELHALGHEANWYYNLFEDKLAFELARSGILARLRQGATPQSRGLLTERSARNKNRKRKG